MDLAYRRGPRALPRVRDALSRPSGSLWRLELVAAGALSARSSTTWSSATRKDGLSRRRAHGRAADDAVDAWRLMDEMLTIPARRAPECFEGVLSRLAGDEEAERELLERWAMAQLATEAAAAE